GLYDNVVSTFVESGTYYLIQSNPLTSSPSYSFRLLDMGAAPPLTLNTTTSGTLTPGSGTDLYSFGGIVGERVFFNAVSGTNAYIYLYGPTGQVVPSSFTYLSGGYFQVTLPVAGQYTLGLEGYSSNTSAIAYSFQLTTPATNTTVYTVG